MLSSEVITNLYGALGIMGKGMLGIFVVISIVALIVWALVKVGSKKK